MNLKRGLFRLWIALSIPWIVFCGYEVYSHDRDYARCSALAEKLREAEKSERDMLIEDYVRDQKTKAEKAVKLGIPSQFDEAKAKDDGYSHALKVLEESWTQRALFQARADEAMHQREKEAYSWYLPTIPILIGLVFLVLPWIVRGFMAA